MSERDILASTYFDRLAIYRRVNITSGSITKQTEQLIAENIPCALSQNKNSASSGDHTTVSNIFLLFSAPDVDLQSGDKAVITCQSGRVKTCLSAEPFIYPDSHLEAVLTAEEKA